jgi:TonB-dependent receptor
MRTKLLFTLIFVLCLTMVQAQNGAIRGVVLDENNLAMPGATIRLNDGETGTISNSQGRYEIYNLPAGQYTLSVSFVGYEDQTLDLPVEANQTTEANFTMESAAILGNEIIIMGDQLKGQAKALNDQRNRPNIANVVASDQIGRFPDANIGDALKRVPGITMQYDQGEARDIIVRGMAPQLNSVTVNGERIPSAEGDNRRIQLDLIPADMIQLIEVNKALTPDMDADAIGGSVNLVTRTSPNGPRISGTLASGYNALSGKPIWTGAVILGNRFFNNKLGAVFSASYNNHDFGSDNIEAEWVDVDGVGAVLDEYQMRQYYVQRVRRSFSLGLDYRINSNHTLYLNGIYNWRDDWENRYRYVVGDLGDAFENGDFTGSGGQYEVLSTVERQTKAGLNSDRIKSRRLEDQRMYNASLGGEHLIANRLKINWSGSYSKASEERPHERYIEYAYDYAEAEDGDPADGIPVRLDITDTRKPFAESIQENQYRSLELNDLSEQFQWTYEDNYSGKIDLQYSIGQIGILKGGFVYRSKTKERDNTYSEYEPTGGSNDGDRHPDMGGSWNSEDEEFEDLLMGNQEVGVEDISKDNFLVGDRYQAGYFASRDYLGGLALTNTSLYNGEIKLDEFITDNYKAEEKITAGYLMADLQITPNLSTIVGVRLEATDIDYVGNSFDEEEEELFGEVEGQNNYTNVLPNVHLKYDFTANTILRFAWTSTLARPNYFDLVPYQAFNSDDAELVEGNPDLKPLRSMNFDLMFENYFKNFGLVSAGGFYKNIDDFIYERTFNNYDHPDFGEVDYTTFQNGESAKVYGAEVAFQKQWRGFGLYLNYTYTQSETKGIEDREGEELPLPGTAKNMFNGSISYERPKLVLRLSLNYASDYLDELGGEAFDDRYYDSQTFLDFNGSYAFHKNWRIFVELNNITNQPLRYYQGIQDRTMQLEYYNMRMNIGIKFDFFGN